MKASVKLFFGCCLAISFSLGTMFSLAEEWRYQGERKKVSLYWRDFPNSSIPEFKAQTQIHAGMASVLAVLLDTESCPQWVHQCKKAVLLGQPTPHQQFIYQVNSVPFAKDRDIILKASLNYRDSGRIITIDIENASNYCTDKTAPPCTEVRAGNYVRINSLVGQYRLQSLDINTVEVTWQQHLELGGNLPSWIVRSKLDDLAYETLAGLGRQATKPVYRDLHLEFIDGNLSVSD